jgi:V8-like Glu-specific endopeptidase
VGEQSEAIVDGTLDFNNHPAVVFIYNARRGGACTGSIVAPRAVLTAKHCVQGRGDFADEASSFRVYTGSSTMSFSAEYRVSEVLPAPGRWDLRDSTDVAMLILSTEATVAPLPISFDSPRTLIGETITAIGFGETPSGGSGTKFRTDKRVERVLGDLVFVEPSVCQGDSGGPLLAADGNIYAVVSFGFNSDGSRPTCGVAEGVFNGWASDALSDFIRDAITLSGSCAPDGEEICDGTDNDCDDAIDEGCISLGDPCTTSEECVGGLCDETPIGRVCTEACTPLTPEIGCGLGFYCARTSGCEGRCAPLAEPADGPLGNDSDCVADTECASLFCGDPGDARRRCLSPCEGDRGTCISGEVCAAPPGACGGCVPAGLVAGPRGLGEPCASDGECRSAMCFSEGGISYCTGSCASDGDCGASFHCRDATCIRGPRGGLGAGCVTSDDCSADAPICAARGTTTWCTRSCDGECGAGFSCVNVGTASVCAPELGLVGESCAMNEDCISGLCVSLPGGAVCTQTCGRDRSCSVGFECVRTADGITNACVAPGTATPPRDDGGCSVSRGGQGPSGLGALGVFLVGVAFSALVFRRRSARWRMLYRRCPSD